MIMKDYTLNKEDKRTFILNYEIKDNKIIVNFASGKKYEVPYTEENEKIILTLMEEQVNNSEKFERVSKKNLKFFKGWLIFSIANIIFDATILLTGSSTAPAVQVICGSWFILSGTLETYALVDIKTKLKDLKKNKLFLNYEDLFKSKEKTDDDVLTEEEIVSETITLNDIDKMSYNEVKEMVDIASFNDEVGLDFTEVPKEKVKSKARALRK